jgi:hypothetical protein
MRALGCGEGLSWFETPLTRLLTMRFSDLHDARFSDLILRSAERASRRMKAQLPPSGQSLALSALIAQ